MATFSGIEKQFGTKPTDLGDLSDISPPKTRHLRKSVVKNLAPAKFQGYQSVAEDTAFDSDVGGTLKRKSARSSGQKTYGKTSKKQRDVLQEVTTTSTVRKVYASGSTKPPKHSPKSQGSRSSANSGDLFDTCWN